MEKEKMYVTPEIEILEVEVEEGFAASDVPSAPGGDF